MQLKKAGLAFLKLGLPAALFAYLLWTAPAEDYRAFWNQPKRWDFLVAAQLIALLAVVLGFFRWRILVLSFGIPFTVREMLRLGFLGYLLNFVSFGSVGGDVFKAILVARDKPEKRPEAVASILLDRGLGLIGLVTLAWLSLAIFAADDLTTVLVGIRRTAGTLALVSMLGLALAVFSGDWFERVIDWCARLPWIGETLARMARAVRQLRSQPQTLLALLIMAICIHTLICVSVFFVSCGVYTQHPSLAEHFMVVPPGMAAGALPIAPGGIGVQEGALAALFQQLPKLPGGFAGILVATVYRLITIAILGIGLLYYWASHGREFEFVTGSAN